MTIMQSLTADNFVKKIKEFEQRDYKKLFGLINLIVSLPDEPFDDVADLK